MYSVPSRYNHSVTEPLLLVLKPQRDMKYIFMKECALGMLPRIDFFVKYWENSPKTAFIFHFYQAKVLLKPVTNRTEVTFSMCCLWTLSCLTCCTAFYILWANVLLSLICWMGKRDIGNIMVFSFAVMLRHYLKMLICSLKMHFLQFLGLRTRGRSWAWMVIKHFHRSRNV